MAEDKPKRVIKKTETLRQRTERAAEAPKVRRINKTAGVVSKPFRAAHRIGKKEYYLPLPDNKVGRVLNKPRKFTPRFFREAWAEVRKVEWPTMSTTMRLTLAVFIFSAVFILLTSIVDFGLDKVFRKLFL